MYKRFFFDRFTRMINELNEVHKKVVKVDELAIRALRIIQKCLLDFGKHLRLHDFGTKAEEMFFIKIVKPEISANRIYYMELFNWWRNRPREKDSATHRAYWSAKLSQIRSYCDKHKDVLAALEKDLKKWTEELREEKNRGWFHHRGIPEEMSGDDDEILARLSAYGRLGTFCLQQLELLGAPDHLEDNEMVGAN